MRRLLFLLLFSPLLQAAGKPNVVIILADDLGWKDVGYNDSEIRTPNLDRLAAEGVRLGNFYVQPTCSPTRTALMTGQSPLRHGILRPIGKTAMGSVDLNTRLVPEYFREAGYQTFMVGKWHLGHARKEMLPMARGFDHVYGNYTGGIGFYDHVHGGGLDWHRNGQSLREEGYATHLLTDEAEKLIRGRDRSRPMFLYFAHNAPHLPNEAPESTIASYSDIENPYRRKHAAMVDELDQSVGRLLDVLEEEGMLENTVIWFMSDNGGLNPGAAAPFWKAVAEYSKALFGQPIPVRFLEFVRVNVEEGGADNGPYRFGKQTLYQGGILVPSVVYWRGHLQAIEVMGQVTVQDVLPTLAQVAGLTVPETHVLDGASRWDLLTGAAPEGGEPFVAISGPDAAVVNGRWKLVQQGDQAELYDLEADPYEHQDVALLHEAVVARLQAHLQTIPRGDVIHRPILEVLMDPDFFGGEEDREPWADVVDY